MVAELDLLRCLLHRGRFPARAGGECASEARRRGGGHAVYRDAIMGIPSDERLLTVARGRLAHLFPQLPEHTAFTSVGCPALARSRR